MRLILDALIVKTRRYAEAVMNGADDHGPIAG